MSHIITIQTAEAPFKDLECLAAAAQRLGGTLKKQATFQWFGAWMDDSPIPEHLFTPEEYQKLVKMTREERKEYLTAWFGTCEYAIAFPNCRYEVGLKADPTGTGWRPIIDWYISGGLSKVFGHGANALTEKNPLLQFYEAEVAKKVAQTAGLAWEETVLPDGKILLEVAYKEKEQW